MFHAVVGGGMDEFWSSAVNNDNSGSGELSNDVDDNNPVNTTPKLSITVIEGMGLEIGLRWEL